MCVHQQPKQPPPPPSFNHKIIKVQSTLYTRLLKFKDILPFPFTRFAKQPTSVQLTTHITPMTQTIGTQWALTINCCKNPNRTYQFLIFWRSARSTALPLARQSCCRAKSTKPVRVIVYHTLFTHNVDYIWTLARKLLTTCDTKSDSLCSFSRLYGVTMRLLGQIGWILGNVLIVFGAKLHQQARIMCT